MTNIFHSTEFYLWVKAFHIIAVIAWMAGMLYLPRLFVYHCETAPGSAESSGSRRWSDGSCASSLTPR